MPTTLHYTTLHFRPAAVPRISPRLSADPASVRVGETDLCCLQAGAGTTELLLFCDGHSLGRCDVSHSEGVLLVISTWWTVLQTTMLFFSQKVSAQLGSEHSAEQTWDGTVRKWHFLQKICNWPHLLVSDRWQSAEWPPLSWSCTGRTRSSPCSPRWCSGAWPPPWWCRLEWWGSHRSDEVPQWRSLSVCSWHPGPEITRHYPLVIYT